MNNKTEKQQSFHIHILMNGVNLTRKDLAKHI